MTERLNNHNNSTEQLNANLFGKDILSVKQFDINTLDQIFESSVEMAQIIERGHILNILSRKILANLCQLYEPSTRTASSFTAAMERLGGSVIETNGITYSSISKGENLSDTISTFGCYADIIVLRHPEQGSVELATKATDKPIINAGDGIGEHPTQALLDYVTIRREQPQIEGLTVTMLGDMKHGRTVHSLARLLSLYSGVTLNYISPEILRMPKEIMKEVSLKDVKQVEYTDLQEVLSKTDVLYVTRIQKERFENPDDYDSVKGSYIITPDTLKDAKKTLTIMHPLPRVGEIDPAVDADPRAAYFRQMKNGLFVRMTVLAGVLGKLPTSQNFY